MIDMAKMRKITVHVRRDHLESAQALTGEGISGTVRIGLRFLVLESRNPTRSKTDLLELARQPFNF
jgi:hypothetical protein